MGQHEDDQLIDAATKEAVARSNERIELNVNLATLFDLIAVVQVALRHPNMKESPPAWRTEKFIRGLIEKIDPEHGELSRLLNLGFDAEHDRKP